MEKGFNGRAYKSLASEVRAWRTEVLERESAELASKQAAINRHATHPVNAMLNYAYGMLENHVRMHVVAAGLDPTIGYLHASYCDKHALVYDLMEPLRPVVDRRVPGFVQSHTFSPADFTLTRNGVCRLNPQLARNIVRAVEASLEPDTLENQLTSELSI